MAFNGVRSSWLILARNAVFEAFAVSASKRLRKRFVARFFQFPRQIFHFETQARVLIEAIGETAAFDEKLHCKHRQEHARRRNRRIVPPKRKRTPVMRGRAAPWLAISMSICVARLTASAPSVRADDAGDENVIDRVAGRPQQPGANPMRS